MASPCTPPPYLGSPRRLPPQAYSHDHPSRQPIGERRPQMSESGCSRNPVSRHDSTSSSIGARDEQHQPMVGSSSVVISLEGMRVGEGESGDISGVLKYCKTRILHPYLTLLSVMGLKPCADNCDEFDNKCGRSLNLIWLVLITILVLAGYALQFLTCFRRDYGFSYNEVLLSSNPNDSKSTYGNNVEAKPLHAGGEMSMKEETLSRHHDHGGGVVLFHHICRGNIFYSHVIPSLLHAVAFGYMICLYWLSHNEYLQNLMERVFIQATQPHSFYVSSKRRVLRTLKFLLAFGSLWLLCSTISLTLQIAFSDIHINFFSDFMAIRGWTTFSVAVVMAFSTLWQDALQVVLIASYCIHCHLISVYLKFLHSRISQHSISLSECIKEIGEVEKLLRYLNHELANGIFPLIILDFTYFIGSVVFLVGGTDPEPGFRPFMLVTTCLSCVQWLSLMALPLIKGAQLNTTLKKVRELGHLVRMRPFGYQTHQQSDLDSFLLFVSTLKMDVRIMRLPLTSPNVSLLACFVAFSIFLWGYFQ